MADVSTFDAADAAFRDTHEKLRGTLTSQDVAALIATASTHIAECDKLAAERIAAASDPDLPTRNALAAKQEADGLSFVAERLRNLVPTLDRRLASERDGEEQHQRREQYDQAVKRTADAAARIRKEYPKATAAILDLVAEIQKADAIAAYANSNLPRDAQPVATVETAIGAKILSKLHLPAVDGTMGHEMTKEAMDAFSTELFNRQQREQWAPMAALEEKRRLAAVAEREAAAEAHNGSEEEKRNIRAGFPPRMVGFGRPAQVA